MYHNVRAQGEISTEWIMMYFGRSRVVQDPGFARFDIAELGKAVQERMVFIAWIHSSMSFSAGCNYIMLVGTYPFRSLISRSRRTGWSGRRVQRVAGHKCSGAFLQNFDYLVLHTFPQQPSGLDRHAFHPGQRNADLRRSGEKQPIHIPMQPQSATGFRSHSGNHIEHAGRFACLMSDFARRNADRVDISDG